MPLYEFKCVECGNIQENIQGFNDPCPACKKCAKETQRQISNSGGIALQFKGNGFYSTDYQRKK